jgi:flagellar hook assembly protein FlgD
MMEKQIYPLNIAPGEQPKPQSPIPTAPKKPTFKEWIKAKKWIFAGVLGVLVVGGGIYAALTMDFGDKVKGQMDFSPNGKLGVEIKSVSPEGGAKVGKEVSVEVHFDYDQAEKDFAKIFFYFDYQTDEPPEERLIKDISGESTVFKHAYDSVGIKEIEVYMMSDDDGYARDTIDYEVKEASDIDPDVMTADLDPIKKMDTMDPFNKDIKLPVIFMEKKVLEVEGEPLTGTLYIENPEEVISHSLKLTKGAEDIKELISETPGPVEGYPKFTWDGKIDGTFVDPGKYTLELKVVRPHPGTPEDLVVMHEKSIYVLPELKKFSFKHKTTFQATEYMNIDNKKFDFVEINYEVGDFPEGIEFVAGQEIREKNSGSQVFFGGVEMTEAGTTEWSFIDMNGKEVEYGNYTVMMIIAMDEFEGDDFTSGWIPYEKTLELKLASLDDATLETFQFVNKNGQALDNPIYDNYEPPTDDEPEIVDEVFVKYEIENLGLQAEAAVFIYEEGAESVITASPWSSTKLYKWKMTANDLSKLELDKIYTLKVATKDLVFGEHQFVDEITLKVGEAEAVLPQCSDLIDNDDDGKIDLLDPGCESGTDNAEAPDPEVEDPITCTYNNKSYDVDEDFDATDTCNTCTCDDDGGITCTTETCEKDTDADTDPDPDPDPDPADAPPTLDLGLSDTPTPAQCDDDLDNDDDGDTDYPEDKGCTSINDKTENSEGGSKSQNETIEITKVSASKTTFNPYINEVQILYTTSEDANVTVSIYNMKGEKITDILSAEQKKGDHNVWWTGTVNNKTLGKKVDDGSYIFKITASLKDFPTIKDTKEGTITVDTQVATNPGDFEDLDGGGAEPAGDPEPEPEPQGTLGSTPVTPEQLIATQTLQNSTTGQSAGTGPGVLIYLLIPALALPFKPKTHD